MSSTTTENGEAQENVLDNVLEGTDRDTSSSIEEDRLRYELYTTTKYEIFDLSKINREIDPNHVNGLKDSMRKHGFIKQKHILVDPSGVVIEGQHRLVAAKELEIPVYYTIADEPYNMELVEDLNMGQDPWTFGNFVGTKARKGIEDYENYQSFTDKYDFPITVAAYIIGISGERVKSGDLQWPENGYVDKVGNILAAIRDGSGVNYLHRKHFISALKKVLDRDQVDGMDLGRKIVNAINAGRLHQQYQVSKYKMAMIEAWNYNRPRSSQKYIRSVEL